MEPERILEHAREAMEVVGKNIEEKLYFLPELMVAGDTAEKVTAILEHVMVSSGQNVSSLGQ